MVKKSELATKSIKYFGVYLLIFGILLAIIPNILFQLVKLPFTEEVWIRVVGLFSIVVSMYYFYAAKYQITQFYMATVYGRVVFSVGAIIFVILGLVQPIVLAVVVIDLLSAYITYKNLN